MRGTKVNGSSRLRGQTATLLVALATLTGARQSTAQLIPADKGLDPSWVASLSVRGERRPYTGAELRTIGMPCGGVCAGQMYVRGDGTLAKWWVFDNAIGDTTMGQLSYGWSGTRPSSPVDQGVALWVKRAGQQPVTLRLSEQDFDSIEFYGEYPIAEIRYRGPKTPVPVDVTLEVFSPFIPLNARESGTPVTILHYTVTNTSADSLDIALAGWFRDISVGLSGTNQVSRTSTYTCVSSAALALAALSPSASATAEFTGWAGFETELSPDGALSGPQQSAGAPRGGVSFPHRLGPAQRCEMTFLVAWFFGRPNTLGWKGGGNMYENWFTSALSVVTFVAANFQRLSDQTRLFRDTYYTNSTLPYWFLQRVAAPVSILASETCQRFKNNGRFWAWEGVRMGWGKCTHVWNYAQAHARLFPELARSSRLLQELGEGFNTANGMVGYRGGVGGDDNYAADGQCGAVLKVYREHLMSPDNAFLTQAWPRTKQAMAYAISHDPDTNGVIVDAQPNTFDNSFYGANTFVGALYLAALRATEQMALVMGEAQDVARYRAIFERGRQWTEANLWNGQYFYHRPSSGSGSSYAGGALSDQLFGQNWAHQLGLGYLYSPDKVASALRSVYRYNWAPDVSVHNATYPPFRVFASPGESGLINCTWPITGKPSNSVWYNEEVWTGVEYQVASHMLYEGLVDEAMVILRGVHERYNGAKHNPWNEVEFGEHYSRALASWGCLLGASGFSYDGPAGVIGFSPRLTPDDFRAFFPAAEGWGSLSQVRDAAGQRSAIEVKFGQVRVRTLKLTAPPGTGASPYTVTLNGSPLPSTRALADSTVTVTLSASVTVSAGSTLEFALQAGGVGVTVPAARVRVRRVQVGRDGLTVTADIPRPAALRIEAFDMRGRRVALWHGTASATAVYRLATQSELAHRACVVRVQVDGSPAVVTSVAR